MFNFKDYEELGGSVCIHCQLQTEAHHLCRALADAGYTWATGQSYLKVNNWHSGDELSCFYFNHGRIGNLRSAKKRNVKIIEFKDIKGDL